jgi:hypothetical protein
MKNFAEEIAYLYFRLNGFFLLDNYVTHASENKNRYHADSDLLGIKTNMVYEEIGLKNENDIDMQLRNLLGTYKYSGLICEVKGGTRVNLSNSVGRIKPCLNRMGLLENEKINEAIEQLKIQKEYKDDDSGTIIIKVAATNKNLNNELARYWNHITLDNMLSFIEERVEKYPTKGRGWNFYSSNMFQYLLKKRQG